MIAIAYADHVVPPRPDPAQAAARAGLGGASAHPLSFGQRLDRYGVHYLSQLTPKQRRRAIKKQHLAAARRGR